VVPRGQRKRYEPHHTIVSFRAVNVRWCRHEAQRRWPRRADCVKFCTVSVGMSLRRPPCAGAVGRPVSMTDVQTPGGGEFRDGTQSPLMPRLPVRGEQHSPVDATDDMRSRPVGSEGRAFAQWWALVLDGRHDWGYVDASPTRHGVMRYRLVVFPPGIDTVERRLLRAWRSWPTRGAMLWVASQIVLSTLFTPGAAFATSTIAYLASGLFLFARVAELRSRVRTLSVVRIAGYTDVRSAAMFVELKSLVAALEHADSQRDRGQSSPADHESAWWQVYDRLGQNHLGPTTC
jgi:hypothetical protein